MPSGATVWRPGGTWRGGACPPPTESVRKVSLVGLQSLGQGTGMSNSEAISGERMLPLLVEADPTFEPAWLEWVAEWSDEPGPPYYIALGSLARHLITRLERGEMTRFPAIFDVVERWHVEGDKYVSEAATVGLLEDLQNANLYTRTQPSDFEPWLRPASRKFWDKVKRFWSHSEIIKND